MDSGSHRGVPLAEKCAVDPKPPSSPSKLSPLVKDRASEVDINKDPLPTVNTLGIMWLPEEDVFTFKGNPPEEHFQLTKRNFLKRIATLFDTIYHSSQT